MVGFILYYFVIIITLRPTMFEIGAVSVSYA